MALSPSPPIHSIWATIWWLSESKGGTLSELLRAVSCTTVEHTGMAYAVMHTNVGSSYKFLITFRLVFVCVFKGLDCIFACSCVSLDHFGLVVSEFFLLSWVFSVPSQEIGWEDRLWNDLFLCRLGRKTLLRFPSEKSMPDGTDGQTNRRTYERHTDVLPYRYSEWRHCVVVSSQDAASV